MSTISLVISILSILISILGPILTYRHFAHKQRLLNLDMAVIQLIKEGKSRQYLLDFYMQNGLKPKQAHVHVDFYVEAYGTQ